jgi:hypothetical protein
MDQVKVVLAVLKKHHFWVLCGIVIVLALVIWAMASSGLAKQYDERKTAIEGKRQGAESIPSQPPNDDTIAAINKERDELKEGVLAAWEYQYRKQKDLNPWPVELGTAFGEYVESLGPEEEIHRDYREVYWTFIREHLPAMVEIVDIRLPALLDENGQPVIENGTPQKTNTFEKVTAASSGGYGSGG